jgi:hypoxanthine phosphoribosyltransferase
VIQLNDRTFDSFLSEEEVLKKVQHLATQLNRDYDGSEVLFLPVLNGAYMFAADLLKEVSLPCELSFVKVQSYQGMLSNGQVNSLIGLETNLTGKNVVVIEDIVDTGLTIDKVRSMLVDAGARSVRVCALLFKPDAFEGAQKPEYVGFSIPNVFVVGYGLDYNGRGRNLKAIYRLTN